MEWSSDGNTTSNKQLPMMPPRSPRSEARGKKPEAQLLHVSTASLHQGLCAEKEGVHKGTCEPVASYRERTRTRRGQKTGSWGRDAKEVAQPYVTKRTRPPGWLRMLETAKNSAELCQLAEAMAAHSPQLESPLEKEAAGCRRGLGQRQRFLLRGAPAALTLGKEDAAESAAQLWRPSSPAGSGARNRKVWHSDWRHQRATTAAG